MFCAVIGVLLPQVFSIGPMLVQGFPDVNAISQAKNFAHLFTLGDLKDFFKNGNEETVNCFRKLTKEYSVVLTEFNLEINDVANDITKKFEKVVDKTASKAKKNLRQIAKLIWLYIHHLGIYVIGNNSKKTVELMQNTRSQITFQDSYFFDSIQVLKSVFSEDALQVEGTYKKIREEATEDIKKIVEDFKSCVKPLSHD